MQSPELDKEELATDIRVLIGSLLGDRLIRRFDLPSLERNPFSPVNSPTLILISNNGGESSIFIKAHHFPQRLEETRMLVFQRQGLPHIITHIHEDSRDEESQSRWLDQWLDKLMTVVEGQVKEASAFDLLAVKGLLARISP